MKRKRRVVIPLIILFVYLLFPVDIIPDFIIGLGQIDDIIVAVINVMAIVHGIKKNQDEVVTINATEV